MPSGGRLMPPKKSAVPSRRSSPAPSARKSPRPRPVGVQTLGPLRYAQLRQALHLLDATAERERA
jgi:hypothetical protein